MHKHLKFFLFSFFLFSLFFSVKGQNIKGVVLDRISEEPVAEAHVFFKNTKSGTYTNKKGRFTLKLPDKGVRADTLVISHISYRTSEVLNPYFTKIDTVFLEQKSSVLSEVQVLQNKRLKRKLAYKKLKSIPTGVYSFATFIKEGKIYILGGDTSYLVDSYLKAINDYPYLTFYELYDRARENVPIPFYSDRIMVYDIATDTWNIRDNKLIKRANHSANLLGNKVYIIGGRRLSDNRLFEMLVDKIEVYHIDDETVEIDKTNPHQAINIATFTYGDNIITMGGSIKKEKDNEKIFTSKVHVFDTKTGLWYDLASMPVAKETTGVLINNKIWLFGGFNNQQLDGIESFDIKTGKWKKEGSLFEPAGMMAMAQNQHFVFFYYNGRLNIFDTEKRILKQYLVDLYLEGARMQYFNGKLYLYGGYKFTKFEVFPSADVYRIDLNELENTRLYKIRQL